MELSSAFAVSAGACYSWCFGCSSPLYSSHYLYRTISMHDSVQWCMWDLWVLRAEEMLPCRSNLLSLYCLSIVYIFSYFLE